MEGVSRNGKGNGDGTPRNPPSCKRPRVSSFGESEVGSVSGPLSASDEEPEPEPEEDEEELGSEEEEEKEEEEEETEKTQLSATFTDLKAFQCPRCKGPLVSPVYQCLSGHITCAKCCAKPGITSRRCHRPCHQRTGTIRCTALEKVLESVTFLCRNTSYGCKETFKNREILDHHKTCVYSPCTCPYKNCNYIGLPKPLYAHFGQAHPHSVSPLSFDSTQSILLHAATQVFLQDSSRTTLFVVQRAISSFGSFVSVVCVAPDSSRGAFSYELTALIDRDRYVKMKAGVECMAKWSAEGISGKCLVIPKDLFPKYAVLGVLLIIKKNP